MTLQMKREAYTSVQDLQSALLSEIQLGEEPKLGGLIQRFQAQIAMQSSAEGTNLIQSERKCRQLLLNAGI